MKLKHALINAACLAVAFSASSAMAQNVVGGGASAPEFLYKAEFGAFATDYLYASTGSGAGKTALLTNVATAFNNTYTPPRTDAVVHFAGSDSVLSSSDISGYTRAATDGNLVQMPSVGTAVGIPFKITGASALKLNTNQLCGIFSGKLSTWNQVLASLPNSPINVVYRGDSSGTTEIFTRHLDAVCTTGTTGNSDVAFPVTTSFSNVVNLLSASAKLRFSAANLSAGVRDAIAAGTNVIGYLSPDYINTDLAPLSAAATQNLFAASLRNKNNNVLYAPTSANITLALTNLTLGPNLADPKSWAPTAANPTSGYPISGLTFLDHVTCYSNSSVLSKILGFLDRHYTYSGVNDNTSRIEGNGFVKLPSTIVAAIRDNLLTNNSGTNLNLGNATACSGKAGR
ncbi:substrate-binding domain-containing protein [Cupriavidus basilensis]|uniref:Phosphate-binding protein PstS n=1 Tax=Cupriavidus basilensis TaxID=68895 RepID=A0ABT6B2C5_9BURK|nr:substrate-binding domain-containing protein [Cupriavidus basilensis]MDF3839047.1 substrate-binding domain-containing protein [Cupriavidus basilensis]